MPFISIVVPVFNKEDVICSFIDGIMQQSFSDFELILVDDKSTDNSLALIKDKITGYDRVKYVALESNSGTLVARKEGAKVASGEYIWYIDPDDELSDYEVLTYVHNTLEAHKVDIFQFGFKLIFCSDLTQEQKDKMISDLIPFDGELNGRDVLTRQMDEGRFINSLCTKIIKRELLLELYEIIPDMYMTMAEDLMISFMITYSAKTFFGDAGFNPYVYKYGIGISNPKNITSKKIKALVAQCTIVNIWKKYLRDNNETDSKYFEYVNKFEKTLIDDCVYSWLYFSDDENNYEILNALIDAWSFNKIFMMLEERFWYKKKDVVQKTYKVKRNHEKREIKTLGILITPNDDVYSVRKLLDDNQLKNFDIVLIKDEKAELGDIELPENSRTEIVPGYKEYEDNNLFPRGDKLTKILEENEIDAVICTDIFNPVMYWDMRSVQSADAYFVVNPAVSYKKMMSECLFDIRDVYQNIIGADFIVSVFDREKNFWKLYNDNSIRWDELSEAFNNKENSDEYDNSKDSLISIIDDVLMELSDTLKVEKERYHELELENQRVNAFCGEIIDSVSFKTGRAITGMPRKLRDILGKSKS